jgi:hypothetical protein
MRAQRDGSLLVAATGVEDHPLVREDGGFGYIDSYIYIYRVAGETVSRLAAINASELGVVTPKWIAFRSDTSIATAGFASPTLVELTWQDFAAPPEVTRTEVPPGTAAAVLADGAWLAANPLFDAWVVRDHVKPIPSAARDPLSRIGELLFFTVAMAPWNGAAGELSRFTCETCHHEGYVDGRVHYTGRDDVHATTRPLYGLFNNRPYFSRALDDSLTQMVHSEFRVANRHNGRDPWFTLSRSDVPWLAYAGAPDPLSPEQLRQALMTFLINFTHRSNPAATDHARFTALEQSGARVFRDRCSSCHAARLTADDPASLVPFERWQELVLSPSGPIVWSNGAYAKTGVEPYVHANGTRVPTLRRLYKKWPYFTNGSARSLSAVLDRFSSDGAHDRGDGAHLTADERSALLAFLDLL